MEQLIFFAVIIALSIMDSIARSRKARARREAGEGEGEPERFEWAQEDVSWDDEIPTYDDDPSYDDQPSYDDRVRREPEPEIAAEHQPPTARDLLEEISNVLSGQQQAEARTRSAPRQSPPLPAPTIPEIDTERSVRRAPRELAADSPYALPSSNRPAPRARTVPGQPHFLHEAHAGYGTDPSSRAPSEQDGLDPLAEYMTRTASAVRTQLRSNSAHELRQAIVLQEVLAPPVSLRD